MMLMKFEIVIIKIIIYLSFRKKLFIVILSYKCGRGIRERFDILWLSIKSWRFVFNFIICKIVICIL